MTEFKKFMERKWLQPDLIVLLNPYSYNPEESFERCCTIVRHLRMKYPHIPIFSPILHTHSYDVNLKESKREYNEDYPSWDFDLYKTFPHKDTLFLFTHDWEISIGCKKEMFWCIHWNKHIGIMSEEDELECSNNGK